MTSKRHWMPLYVMDYLGDTAHLSTAEHGAYLLLIMHYWIKGQLPPTDDAIQRITRMTNRQWAKSRNTIRLFFTPDWKHHRIDREIAQVVERSRVNSANAVKSHANRKPVASEPKADLQPTLHTSHSTPQQTERVVLLDPKVVDEGAESEIGIEHGVGTLIDPAYRPNDRLIEQCRADGAIDAVILEQIKLFVAYNEDRGTRSKAWDAKWTLWWARWKERREKELAKVPCVEVKDASAWKPTESNWDKAIEAFKLNESRWPRWGGNAPGSKACKCPHEIPHQARHRPCDRPGAADMSRTPARFTQAQVRRAIKAVESAGLRVKRVTVKPDGSITVDSGDNALPAMDSPEISLATSWDDV